MSSSAIPAAVKALSYTTAVSSLGGLYLFYDYKTCHPMRQIKYEPKEALVRFHNTVVNQLPYGFYTQLSLKDLAQFDGSTKKKWQGPSPTYFSAAGKIYDVSSSEMFQSAYSQWAGKDATVALARMSLKAEDVNRTDCWKSLDKADQKSLQSWLDYFDQKYYIKGRLVEYHQGNGGGGGGGGGGGETQK